MRSVKAVLTASLSLLVNLAAITYLCISILERHSTIGTHQDIAVNASTPTQENQLLPIENSTFGLEKVFVIGLPTRSDRRDTLSLSSTSHGQNVDLTWRAGIPGEEVDELAMPQEWDPTKLKVGALGCWRSHMNILREVVENRISTALIMEDDVRWEPNIKQQLAEMASLLPELPGISNSTQPYSAGWDIMWLGTCMHPDPPAGTLLYEDSWTGETRMLWNVPGGVACTLAYAVTWESAREILNHLSHAKKEVDLELAEFCDGRTCPLVWPSIFMLTGAASNINPPEEKQEENAISEE